MSANLFDKLTLRADKRGWSESTGDGSMGGLLDLGFGVFFLELGSVLLWFRFHRNMKIRTVSRQCIYPKCVVSKRMLNSLGKNVAWGLFAPKS